MRIRKLKTIFRGKIIFIEVKSIKRGATLDETFQKYVLKFYFQLKGLMKKTFEEKLKLCNIN